MPCRITLLALFVFTNKIQLSLHNVKQLCNSPTLINLRCVDSIFPLTLSETLFDVLLHESLL